MAERVKRHGPYRFVTVDPIRFYPGRSKGEIRLTDDIATLAGEYPSEGTRYQTGYWTIPEMDNTAYKIEKLISGEIRFTVK